MNKFDRVISTLILLQSRKVIKANTIANRYDISLRTVYRDISTLKQAGVPIIGDPGIGYSIMDGYNLPPIMINENEAAALLTGEKFIGKLTDTETQEYYTNAMLKIKAILRSSEKQALEVLDNSIAISNKSTWDNKTYLQIIFKAIAYKHVLSIEYQKSDGSNSQRKVEPIGCYHQSNNWYVVAYCKIKKDYRTFKMNRIKDLHLLEQRFDKKHFSLQDYIEQQDDSWKKEQQFKTIEVIFNDSVLEFAERRKYYFGFVEQHKEDNATRMVFLNPSLEIIARWLLQFSDQATIIAPPALKQRLKTLSTQLYHHHQ